MCTNGLEDYIDELVECFEDFIRKSLLMISVTLGTIVLMVMYVLKLLSDRPSAALTSRDYEDEYDDGMLLFLFKLHQVVYYSCKNISPSLTQSDKGFYFRRLLFSMMKKENS